MTQKDNWFEWQQFAKLGEMIGDGMHHEEPWISKEYKKLSRLLVPEIKEAEKEKRKLKGQRINEQMAKLLLIKFCKCGGLLVQARSGSKICYCSKCNARYKARGKK